MTRRRRELLVNMAVLLVVIAGLVQLVTATDNEALAALLIPAVFQLVVSLVGETVQRPAHRPLRGLGFLVAGAALLGLCLVRAVDGVGNRNGITVTVAGVAIVLIAFGVARRFGRWDRRPGSGMQVGAVVLLAILPMLYSSDGVRVLVLLPIPVCAWLAGARLARIPATDAATGQAGRVALMIVPAPGGGVIMSVMALVTDHRAGRTTGPAWWALVLSSVTTLVFLAGTQL